jgi:hypothetical protein
MRTWKQARGLGATLNVLLLAALAGVPRPVCAQNADGADRPFDVSGAVTVTTKGISLIPSFTLGRPAAVFDLAIRKAHVGFEPQFRFGLDGKPWSFLLWWRYRMQPGDRFRLTVGGHPSFSFKTISASTDGAERDLIRVTRYLAGEVSPTYALTDKVSLGAYYLYSNGIDPESAQHTHFVAARATVTDILIAEGVSVQIAPQLYYLWTDDEDGVYLGSSATLSVRDFPFSIATVVNAPLRTGITGGNDFLWNVSLVYAIR